MKNLRIFTSEVKELGTISKGPEKYFCEEISDTVKEQDLTISFTLSDCENEVLLNGDISGSIVLECSRCLEAAEAPVKIKMCASFPSTQELVDIGEEIKQLLVLNLPVKPLCKNDCNGLCPVCGKNRNLFKCGCSQEIVDPRWGQLKQILKKSIKEGKNAKSKT